MGITTREVLSLVDSKGFYTLDDFENFFGNEIESVKVGVDVNPSNIYTLSTNIYKTSNGYVGVRGISALYAKFDDISKLDCRCVADEYKRVVKYDYVPK